MHRQLPKQLDLHHLPPHCTCSDRDGRWCMWHHSLSPFSHRVPSAAIALGSVQLPRLRYVSRTQVLLTKISQTCQSIRDMKKTRKQLVFHGTSNTSKGITSCSSPQGHSILHPSTGDGDGRDDNAKKSNSSTSSSVGGTHTPGTPTHRDPILPAPDPAPTSRSPSPGRDPRSPPPDDEGGSSPAS